MRARPSPDCPSQNIACFRTSGLRFVFATWISLGTPSPLGHADDRVHRFRDFADAASLRAQQDDRRSSSIVATRSPPSRMLKEPCS